jgi:coenzyme F420-reducing hydrogenase beta subunit
MVDNEQGFSYPSVDEAQCIECGKCVDVCPYLDQGTINSELFPETSVYAVKHESDSIRMASSSGGAFTAISDFVIKSGGVVYGAAYDSNMVVRHARATTVEERNTLRGSKYVQSNVGDVFSQVADDLKKGTLVLFSGTPCQIAGLRLFLGKPQSNLITVDLVCHGVPSPRLFSDYIDRSEIQHGPITGCDFRDKSKGWGVSVLKLSTSNNTKTMDSSDSSFYSLFQSRIMLRSCCYECKFPNFNRPGDITIGDYWGIDRAHPGFKDEKGVSLVLINSIKGKQVWDGIKGSLVYLESTQEACLQTNLHQPTSPNPKRAQFWADYHRKGYGHIARKYGGQGLYWKMRRMVRKIVVNTPLMGVYRMIKGGK